MRKGRRECERWAGVPFGVGTGRWMLSKLRAVVKGDVDVSKVGREKRSRYGGWQSRVFL